MQLLSVDDAKKATPVGLPVLLDNRLTNGRRTFHRASARDIEPRANAFSYVAGVRGTSGVVVQFYRVPTQLGTSINVEPELSPYDAAKLREMRGYR